MIPKAQETWRDMLLRDGYVHWPSLAPLGLVAAARAEIERDLKEHFDPARLTDYNNQSWCPELRGAPVITRLLDNAPVRKGVDRALGSKVLGGNQGQIAIRKAGNAQRATEPTAHIDGIPTASNGLSGETLQSFTALVGVFLTPVRQRFAGNFTVWPGSHLQIEGYFRQRGPAALAEGMPPVSLGEPHQLLCEPGDVVLCHYELAHAAAANTAGQDRIAIFFRLWFPELDGPLAGPQRWYNLTHLWHGWRV